MTKSSGKKNNISKAKGPRKLQHAFLGMREPMVIDVANRKVVTLSTDSSSGNFTFQATLSPQGLRGVALSSGASFVGGVLLDAPHLLWLYNQSSNFGMYRVTRAKLIFIGNQGTNVQGSLNLFGSSDPMDVSAGINTAFMQGPGSRSFDLSNAGSKEVSLNIPVDSSWKKVSNLTTCVANQVPFSGTVAGFANVNSVADLCFAGIGVQVIGAPLSTTIGSVFLDYDVEFKDPMAIALNQ